jgi:hypothetical protein
MLALEQSTQPRVLGTLRAAVRRMQSSLFKVFEFARLRRAYATARAEGDAATDLATIVTNLREEIEFPLTHVEPRTLLQNYAGAWAAWLRRPEVLLWLVLMQPPFFWFVVGGWPQTAWLQRTMTGPVAWKLVLALSVAAQSWLAWQVIIGVRSWPRAVGLPVADDAATVCLRVICGVGAVSLGGYAVVRGFTGLSPWSGLLDSAHASEAATALRSASALAAANSASALFPPVPLQPLAQKGWQKWAAERAGKTSPPKTSSPSNTAHLEPERVQRTDSVSEARAVAEATAKAARDAKIEADKALAGYKGALGAYNKYVKLDETAQAQAREAEAALAKDPGDVDARVNWRAASDRAERAAAIHDEARRAVTATGETLNRASEALAAARAAEARADIELAAAEGAHEQGKP